MMNNVVQRVEPRSLVRALARVGFDVYITWIGKLMGVQLVIALALLPAFLRESISELAPREAAEQGLARRLAEDDLVAPLLAQAVTLGAGLDWKTSLQELCSAHSLGSPEYRLAESGKEQLVRFLNPGDFTGELALFSESKHEAYAEAVKETQVCRMKRNDLQHFLLKYPAISLKLLQEFSNRLEKSERQTTYVSTEKVEARLALYLAELAKKDGDTITLPMSKKDLASYLGTTPETISRKMGSLEDHHLIKQLNHREIVILDLDGLLFL